MAPTLAPTCALISGGSCWRWGGAQARRKLEKGCCPGLALLRLLGGDRPEKCGPVTQGPPHLAPLAESQSSRKERSAQKTKQVPALFWGKSQAPPSLCRFVSLGRKSWVSPHPDQRGPGMPAKIPVGGDSSSR